MTSHFGIKAVRAASTSHPIDKEIFVQVLFKLLTGIALMTCPSTVSAATLVQTVVSANGPAYGYKFDTAWGTLSSVTVESSVFARQYFNFPSQLGQPVVSVVGKINGSQIGGADISGDYQSGAQDPLNIAIIIHTAFSATETADFSQFIGTTPLTLLGDLRLESTTVNGNQLRPGTVFFPGGSGGTFTVTYDYIAAVPEASTWLMMLTGFGLVAGAARYRRRHAAVTFA